MSQGKSKYKDVVVTDDYLFLQKEYVQYDRTFIGVTKPKALWEAVKRTEKTYEDTKSECMRAYGFYYEQKDIFDVSKLVL